MRSKKHEKSLKQSLSDQFEWQRPQDCPQKLDLYLLQRGDSRRSAQILSCNQSIAADGVFAVGMLVEFDYALQNYGATFYPRMYWECGLIGQQLYLEAEAAGIKGTGIGCFFDDNVHQLLGIQDTRWQSLYHFNRWRGINRPATANPGSLLSFRKIKVKEQICKIY